MNEDELTRMDVIAFTLAVAEIAKKNANHPHVYDHWIKLFDKLVDMYDISTHELNNFRWPDLRKRYDMRIFNLQITKEVQ